MNPLVSIIIPTYNRAHLICETLDSILFQTYEKWECIIVDDGSTDKTEEILSKYIKKDRRFQLHHRPNNRLKGGNAARNYGLEVSNNKSDYIIWFDSDDLMAPFCLEKRLNFIEQNKQYDFAVFSMGLYKDGIKYIDESRSYVNKSNSETIKMFLIGRKIPWQVSRPIYKRSVVTKLKFNERLLRFQDIEYSIRLLKLINPNYISIDETDSFYRLDAETAQRNEKSSFKNQVLSALLEFYTSMFENLDRAELSLVKAEFLDKLYSIIKSNQNPETKLNILIKLIKVFDKNLGIHFKYKLKIYGMIIINKFLYNRKGHYKVHKVNEYFFN